MGPEFKLRNEYLTTRNGTTLKEASFGMNTNPMNKLEQTAVTNIVSVASPAFIGPELNDYS